MNTANFKVLVAAALLSALGLFSATASAATVAGGTFTVTATVAASCKTASATAIAFGSLDPSLVTASDTYVGGTVSVQCTKGEAFTVLMDVGTNAATPGNETTRRMKDGTGDYLPYHLCTGAACTGTNEIAAVPTASTAGTVNLTGTGTGTGAGNAASVAFVGDVKLTDLEVAPASTSYTDTITVTISY